jgi:hypothetical protein
MAKFNIKVQHQLEREVVVNKLRNFSDEMRDRMMVQLSEISEVWDDEGNLDFSFKAMGFKVSGQMVTCEKQVTVFGELPFAALPFRGAIESQVEQKIREVIA